MRKTWWSLQPVQNPTVPAVADGAWSDHPVDRFLLAKLEASQLAPAADTDRRTLARRLAFTLTGLPPTPEEVSAFLVDSVPDAAGRLADRYLASPRFGEHWARHWMDLTRYAETHGSEGDPEIPEAWRYRDYLIRAFNADVPADQLIREHLAGDLLPAPRMNPDGFNESLLGLAHFRLVEHGFQPVDTLDEQVKTVDNQIDVVSKAFQGLTVSCARCHDHKFDAISQRDYYALYGIFASCRPAQIGIDAPSVSNTNRTALEGVHEKIRSSLADAWIESARHLAGQLDEAEAREKRAVKRRELALHLAELGRKARQRLTASEHNDRVPAPWLVWDFERDEQETANIVPAILQNGARIENGHLILDGKAACLRTEPLPHQLTEKTLEAWVSPANLDQQGGGVISIETVEPHAFDAIVFAEQDSRLWMAGSEFGARSQKVDGPVEVAQSGTFVHVAIAYRADGIITVFRNGAPYGETYRQAPLHEFPAGESRLLLGLRHTGAGNGFFAGEIEEARVYDRALEPAEIAASFAAGLSRRYSPQQILDVLNETERAEYAAATAEQKALLTAQTDKENNHPVGWENVITEATKDRRHPLSVWAEMRVVRPEDFVEKWESRPEPEAPELVLKWNLADGDDCRWFHEGSGLAKGVSAAGEFMINPDGDAILSGLFPAGVLTHRLSDKHNGLLTSPRFKIETDSISVHAAGHGGAMVRVIVDHYPLGTNDVFPKAELKQDVPGWIRLDTAYRKGSMAYLEFGTRDDLTRPLAAAGKDGRSAFFVDRIVFHDGNTPPPEPDLVRAALLTGAAVESTEELAARYQAGLIAAIEAWRDHRADAAQAALLDGFVRHRLLPTTLPEVPTAAPLVAEYRRLESAIPVARRAPGILETKGFDSPLLSRGDHRKPGDDVPRGYLRVLGADHLDVGEGSGRLALADSIVNAQNPLTSRVLANRIWHWIFGQGIVATVDNLGRLGERPSHPELLDHLATHLIEHGWSIKQAIRYLVTTRAFRLSSVVDEKAPLLDPGNALLSHASVRRIEAESLRDSLLAMGGRLDPAMFGPPAGDDASRRSIYLPVRRTALNPFLAVFDAPVPFSTLGRRDATNVPAQSLALLNSPFIAAQAKAWAEAVVRDDTPNADSRIEAMFVQALARPPSDDELAASRAYLDETGAARNIPPDRLLADVGVWQDFALSLFNLKEFIYLR